MDNLLKILPLMDMPESIRQPLLVDALAGKGNAMVGFIAARQASDAATSVVAEKDQATAANATTMARLETFHGALVKTGTLPDDLKVFDAFKTKLLANEASAAAVGSSIVCAAVDDDKDQPAEAADSKPGQVISSRMKAFHEALIDTITVPDDLGDFRAFFEKMRNSDAAATGVGTSIREAIRASAKQQVTPSPSPSPSP